MNIQITGAFGADSIVQFNQQKGNPRDTFTSYFPLWTKIQEIDLSLADPMQIKADTILLVVNLNQKTWEQIGPYLNQYAKTILIQFEARKGWELAYEKASFFDYFISFDPTCSGHPGFRRMNIPYNPEIASSHRDKRGFSAVVDQWRSSRKMFFNTYLLKLFPPKKKSVMVATLNKGANYNIRKALAENWRNEIDVFGGGWPITLPNYRGFISSKVALLRRYRYCMVVENQRQPGYVTEKLLDCIAADTVPIYWGAPDVHQYPGLEWVPTIEDESADIKAIIANEELFHECKQKISQNRNLIFDTFATDRFVELVAETLLCENEPEQGNVQAPSLTIIIPTYQRSQGLEKLLKSIDVQKETFSDFEVIVVDNAPQTLAENWQIVEKYRSGGLNVKLVHQALAGATNARNMGIELARGKWLAFFDDDEELHPRYLSVLASYLASADTNSILGGPYLPVWDDEPPRWMKPDYFRVSFGEVTRPLNEREFLPGGNLVASKALVELAGGYPINFGHFGKKMGYGEDTLFVVKAKRQGARQVYDPALAVSHHIPAERMNLEWFTRQKQLSANAKARIYHLQHGTPQGFLKRLRLKASYFRSAFKGCCRWMILGFKGLFRDQKLYPYAENYAVEVVLPQLARYKISAVLFSLIPLWGNKIH